MSKARSETATTGGMAGAMAAQILPTGEVPAQAADGIAGLVNDTFLDLHPERSNAGGKPAKGKGPRKPRSPARTVVYIERLFAKFPLAQRKAMYAMLASVCQPEVTEESGPGWKED